MASTTLGLARSVAFFVKPECGRKKKSFFVLYLPPAFWSGGKVIHRWGVCFYVKRVHSFVSS